MWGCTSPVLERSGFGKVLTPALFIMVTFGRAAGVNLVFVVQEMTFRFL